MNVGQANDIAVFVQFNQLVAEASDEQSILRLLLDTVDAFIPHVDMAIVYLYDENQKVLRLGAGTGVSVQSLRQLAFKPGESLTGKVFLSKNRTFASASMMLSEKWPTSHQKTGNGFAKAHTNSMLRAPLMCRSCPMAVV